MKGKFIIVIPYHFEFYKNIINNILEAGYDISTVFITDQSFTYKKNSHRIYNFIRKLFGNSTYKQKLRVAQNSDDLIKELSKISLPVDYALVIRSDFINSAALSCLKEKSNKLVCYQWDGFKRSPTAQKLIHFFDTFFVFDINDYKKHKNRHSNMKFITNFYLDTENKNVKNDGTAFFVGRYLRERTESIIKLSNFLNEIGIKTNINIFVNSKKIRKKIASHHFIALKEPLTYEAMLSTLKSSSYVLDFDNTEHKGLTFRTFEALFFQKKLITNNRLVYEYDFYHPNNIFVWDEENMEEIEDFLHKPYQKIEDTIIEKYSFTNWIRNVVREQPFTEISIPKV